jgi:hypothetical protein
MEKYDPDERVTPGDLRLKQGKPAMFLSGASYAGIRGTWAFEGEFHAFTLIDPPINMYIYGRCVRLDPENQQVSFQIFRAPSGYEFNEEEAKVFDISKIGRCHIFDKSEL